MSERYPAGLPDAARCVIEAVRTRRSVRRYRRAPVARELLELIVDCGRLAPSANNVQSWEFVVVTEEQRLQRLAELATYGRFIRDAGACIVVCGNPSNRSVYLDGAAAAQNMLLAIHALGLASCWVQGFEKDYNAPIKELLAIPEPLVLVALLPVAHSADRAVAMPRKRELAEVLHWERF
jgi:nitroreductase